MEVGDNRGCMGEPVRAPAPSGYLASYVAEVLSLGSSACPWKIYVEPGQRINVSLYDFSSWAVTQKHDMPLTTRACHIVGKIREGDREAEVRACVGYQRVRQVYASATEHIEIEIYKPISSRLGGYYLLKYEGNYFFMKYMLTLQKLNWKYR